RTSGRPNRRDPTGRAGTDLGQELDLLLQWWPVENTEILTGYARFFPGSYVEKTGGISDEAQWLVFQATYSF
ncbi:MAG: alginate export family protein, partial [Kiritimatiellae bacterium]|nr:alginate export family protein [Kiritimatiellia bacterium]